MQLSCAVKKLNLTTIFGVVLLSSISTLAHANTFSQLAISAGNESNVPRGLGGAHEKESDFMALEYTLGKLFEVGVKNTFVLSAAVDASRFYDLRGFDSVGLSVAANYNYKWALGAYAPVVSVSTSYAVEEYVGRARDNDLLTVDVSYMKRLSPAWFLTLGADYQNSGADSLAFDPVIDSYGWNQSIRPPFELYDYDSTSVYADLEYGFENGMLLNAGYRRVDGFTVSSTTTPKLALYKVAGGLYSDPAFKKGWVAYQLEADTNEWSLGLSIPSGRDSSMTSQRSMPIRISIEFFPSVICIIFSGNDPYDSYP